MKYLSKPRNKWGWLRVTGWAVLAGMVVWMAWTSYQKFPLMDGFERLAAPLLLVVVSGWLEDQDLKIETERSDHLAAEQAVTAQRKAALERIHEALAGLREGKNSAAVPAGLPAQARLKLHETTRAVLPGLDGKGRGEFLCLLFDEGLLSGEKPVLDLNGADLSGTFIDDAQLNGVCLDGANLANARMDSAHLVESHFAGADLRRALLRHADLRQAILAGCDLSGANLEGANLEGADLREACIKAAFLKNANLKNCRMESLDQAVLIDTILPDGQKHTNEKGKEFLKNKEIAFLIDRL